MCKYVKTTTKGSQRNHSKEKLVECTKIVWKRKGKTYSIYSNDCD